MTISTLPAGIVARPWDGLRAAGRRVVSASSSDARSD